MNTPRVTLESGVFYTYTWLRRDGSPYYVGKGKWNGKHHFTQERAYRKGAPDNDKVIIQEQPTESDAFFAEAFLIAFYGREDIGTGCLRNRTDGGEGMAGCGFTDSHRTRIATSLRIIRRDKPIPNYDPQAHAKLMTGAGNPMYGKKRIIDDVWRAKLSCGKLGHTVSEETRRKMSIAARSRKYHPSHCHRGHPFTAENTWVGKTGSRFCLQCRRINHDAANLRKKQRREAGQCLASA